MYSPVFLTRMLTVLTGLFAGALMAQGPPVPLMPDTLQFIGLEVIPFAEKFEKTKIEGLSGIAAGQAQDEYLLVSDVGKPHYYRYKIEFTPEMVLTRQSVAYVKASCGARLESLRPHPKTGLLYFTDERSNGKSFVWMNNANNKRVKLFRTKVEQDNKGIEGMSFSPNGKKLYFSLERLTYASPTTLIYERELVNGSDTKIEYKLDEVPGDDKHRNGISEILALNETDFIVVERVYIRAEKRMSVRVYQAEMHQKVPKLVKQKQLFDFKNLPDGLKVDNVEGVALSKDNTHLIFVTDNNRNENQQTQVIGMQLTRATLD